MTDDRTEFEEAMRGFGLNFKYERAAGAYYQDSTQCAWLGWTKGRERLAAGASEGQEPVGWAVREKHFPDRLLFSDETGEKPSQADREWAEKKGHEYVPLYLHPSAEIAALRERIAELEREQLAWRKFTDEANATMDKADARIAGMEKDARNSSFDAQIGHALIANGLYDRMNDIVDADEPRRLVEELIAVVHPILDAKWAARDAAIAKEKK